MKQYNRIWKGKQSANVYIWAIIVFVFLFYAQFKYEFNEYWILAGIPFWIMLAFVSDRILGLTPMDD